MEIWGAIINAGTADETILGVYSSENLALDAAKRVSPKAADVLSWVLDETPAWVEEFNPEEDD